MSDLISRSNLIMRMSDYALQESPNDNESTGEQRISKMIYDAIQNCISCVEEQPTAYDIGNVVSELEEMIHPKQLYFCKYAKGGCKHLDNNDKDCMECVVENAIEIVKQGGVADDVCEWKFEESNGIAWHCNDKCTTYNQVYIKDLKITLEDFECKCPYCGKKIKVVE